MSNRIELIFQDWLSNNEKIEVFEGEVMVNTSDPKFITVITTDCDTHQQKWIMFDRDDVERIICYMGEKNSAIVTPITNEKEDEIATEDA